MYTSKEGTGVGIRKGTAEFITNIEALVIALSKLEGPKKLIIKGLTDELIDKVNNATNQIVKDFDISFKETKTTFCELCNESFYKDSNGYPTGEVSNDTPEDTTKQHGVLPDRKTKTKSNDKEKH